MTLAFDIETIGRDLDEETRAAVVKGLDDEKAAEAIGRIALSPFTGAVVVIACWDDAKGEGVCLVADSNPAIVLGADILPGFSLVLCADERVMLQRFWSICSRQRRFATFNGGGFDVPFLVGRSLALGVVIHRPLIETKPWEDVHVDLLAKLAPGRKERASFDIVCRALGVPSPKSGIDGSQVGEAWAGGRRGDVAAYCCRDVRALVECLARWDRCALGRAEPAAVGGAQ